jgi:hypothetical protein
MILRLNDIDIEILAMTFAICRLPSSALVPDWLETSAFASSTRTPHELSIVCDQTCLPAETPAEKDWRCLKVKGPLPLNEVGIFASLSQPLAEAGISLFAVSTFETDYLLVRSADLERAVEALERAGVRVVGRRDGDGAR